MDWITRLKNGEATEHFEPIGPYQPLKELGRGGQALVYLAEDLRLHRPVALKILPAGVRGFSGPIGSGRQWFRLHGQRM